MAHNAAILYWIRTLSLLAVHRQQTPVYTKFVAFVVLIVFGIADTRERIIEKYRFSSYFVFYCKYINYFSVLASDSA